MKSYIDKLGNLGVEFRKELAVDMVLSSFFASNHQFIMYYNMNNLDYTLMELHGMLKTAEASMLKTKNSNSLALFLAIGHGGATTRRSLFIPKERKRPILDLPTKVLRERLMLK